jgi:hypothetical protein
VSERIRFTVNPGDVPAVKIARRLHLTLAEFQAKLPELLARGFPPPDPTTGMFDLEATDEWRRRRHPRLFLTQPERARDARAVLPSRRGVRSGQGEDPVLPRQAR